MSAGPQALIAEITHRCPLHCVYCSNPLQMRAAEYELSTAQWVGIIQQAAQLGCWHLHLTGGEPLSRKDTEELVRAGRAAGLYVNLITSGLGLTRERLQDLVAAGLDHIQLSFQDSNEGEANEFAGTRAHAYKLRVAEWIREHRIAFTVNVVVQRENIDRLEQLIALAEELKADKLEIANVQYYGWALKNRSKLLPTREQVRKSLPVMEAARARLAGRMRVDFVLPDYYAKFPKACMGGWGQGLMLIDPAGRRCLVMRPASFRACYFRMPAWRAWRRSGTIRRRSAGIAGSSGCRSRAVRASAKRWILAGAGARQCC